MNKRIPKIAICATVFFCTAFPCFSQQRSLVNTGESKYALLKGVALDAVEWTHGFWAERNRVCTEVMVPELFKTYTSAEISHAFKNFEIAAGKDTGSHSGPPFHDGDFYKLLEAMAAVYAAHPSPQLDRLMDSCITIIAATQRSDGYIHTPVVIAEKNNAAQVKAFQDRLNFETYNMGHLMTAGCVHFRATGKRNLLDVAIKATDYLNNFYKRSSPELARNAICPSHYMGVVEMYRTTKDTAYLELAKNLINIRGLVENGTDDNQDRIPFRQQSVAMGHAVRANYLYAGVADVFAETGEDSLMMRLRQIWEDVTQRKMYITGACGALYDGVSPYGTSYEPPFIQKTHQSYGRAYQLPNVTAHNETCANIGNVLWNWRMLQLTGNAAYADVMELALYNSVLSGISLNGRDFFYTNPLSASTKFPYQLRWHGGRVPYIKLSNCCPPNVVRTIAEVRNYMYSVSGDHVYVNMYGGNRFKTVLPSGEIDWLQETAYPWNGNVKFTIMNAGKKDAVDIHLRIPGWSDGKAIVKVNGAVWQSNCTPGTYVEVRRLWQKGDVLELELPMPVTLMEANPLVEEVRNQVAVKRGPIVYCLESADLPVGTALEQVSVAAVGNWKETDISIAGTRLLALEAELPVAEAPSWKGVLYRPVNGNAQVKRKMRLIPYFAWANRGAGDMAVWLPLRMGGSE